MPIIVTKRTERLTYVGFLLIALAVIAYFLMIKGQITRVTPSEREEELKVSILDAVVR